MANVAIAGMFGIFGMFAIVVVVGFGLFGIFQIYRTSQKREEYFNKIEEQKQKIEMAKALIELGYRPKANHILPLYQQYDGNINKHKSLMIRSIE